MEKIGKTFFGMGIILFVLGTTAASAQSGQSASGAANPPSSSASADQGKAAPAPDRGAAYYHFMLARRDQELAGVYNRSDLVEQAIAEYKQAMADDPSSLFLRTQLAELYYRVSRVGEAVEEAQGVLKVDPDNADAHRVLATIYLHNLGENQGNAAAKDSLAKAVEHLEALVRLDPKDVSSYVTLGRLYRLENQEAKAEAIFKKALNADPSSHEALKYLAQLYSDQGDTADAIAALKGIPESEMDPSALAMLGQAYSQAHDFSQAQTSYQAALALDPENQEIREHYAEALMATGKTAAARGELQKILKADPEDAAAHLRLGRLDRVEGRFDDGRKELQRAQTLQPGNLEASYEQVLLEEAAGNNDQAIEIVQGLLKNSEKPGGQYTAGEASNRAAFLEQLGVIYRTEEKYPAALDTFREIVALGESQAPRGEVLIIETLRLNHHPDQALAEAEKALKAYPKDRSLVVLHASMLGEQGHVDEAVQEIQALSGGAPKVEDELAIAQVYLQAKRFTDAESAGRKAFSEAAKPDEQENARFMLGSIYEREKKFDRAEEAFKQVLAVDPTNGPAANYLGYMLADRGVRLEESVKYVQQALQTEPNNGAYLDSLGWAYFKMRRFDLAEGPLERAARLITDDPTILEHLGNVHLQLGKERLAVEEWERAIKEWPKALDGDFDATEAAALQKKLDDLKTRLAKERPDGTQN